MDVERTTGTNEKGKERRAKKFNGGKITDNIMRGVIMLIMAVVCVMISDQIIATPYFSAEIEVRFSTAAFSALRCLPLSPIS